MAKAPSATYDDAGQYDVKLTRPVRFGSFMLRPDQKHTMTGSAIKTIIAGSPDAIASATAIADVPKKA